MFYALILSMTWRACFITDTWTWLHHLFVWGSVFLELAFMLLYSAFPGAFFGTAAEMTVSLWFWFNCVFFVPFVTVLLDIVYKQVRLNVKPLSSEILQEEEHALKVQMRNKSRKCASGRLPYTHRDFGGYFPVALGATDDADSGGYDSVSDCEDSLPTEDSFHSVNDSKRAAAMREVEMRDVGHLVRSLRLQRLCRIGQSR